jgi:hypothetical protein
MKTAQFLSIGLITLSLYHPVYAQTAPAQSAQQPVERKASKAAHKSKAYDGPVVMNPKELGEKMRYNSRPADKVNLKVAPRKVE